VLGIAEGSMLAVEVEEMFAPVMGWEQVLLSAEC